MENVESDNNSWNVVEVGEFSVASVGNVVIVEQIINYVINL